MIVGRADLSQLFPSANLQPVVGIQPQDGGQNRLAVGRSLAGEFVGSALEQEGRVYEGVVVHADELLNFLLGFPHGVAGDGLGIIAVEQLQLQVGNSGSAPS